MKTISTIAKDKSELNTLIRALYAIGLRCSGYTAEKFVNGGYLHVVLYEGNDISGNYGACSYNPELHGELLTPEAFLFAAAERKFPISPPQVKLNQEYTAIINRDFIKVGCQTFEADKVLEVAEKIKELRK